MKKYICLLLAFVMATGMLSGCLPADDHNLHEQPSTTASTALASTPTIPTTVPTVPTTIATQPTTVPAPPENSGMELESQLRYYSTLDFFPGSAWPTDRLQWPIVIESMEELQEFAKTDFATHMKYIQEIVSFYDDAFFAENTLILACLYTKPCFQIYMVEQCVKMEDGTYSISLEKVSGGSGDSFPYYVIAFIEVKDDVPKDAVIHFDVPEEYAKLVTN